MHIPLVAQTVLTVDYGFSFLLITSGGFEIRIESTFRLIDLRAGQFEEVPDQNLSSDPVFGDLIGKAIDKAQAAVDGTLTHLLSGHTTLTVPADPDFEAWTVAGPGGMKIVCEAGGDWQRGTSVRRKHSPAPLGGPGMGLMRELPSPSMAFGHHDIAFACRNQHRPDDHGAHGPNSR